MPARSEAERWGTGYAPPPRPRGSKVRPEAMAAAGTGSAATASGPAWMARGSHCGRAVDSAGDRPRGRALLMLAIMWIIKSIGRRGAARAALAAARALG